MEILCGFHTISLFFGGNGLLRGEQQIEAINSNFKILRVPSIWNQTKISHYSHAEKTGKKVAFQKTYIQTKWKTKKGKYFVHRPVMYTKVAQFPLTCSKDLILPSWRAGLLWLDVSSSLFWNIPKTSRGTEGNVLFLYPKEIWWN